MPNANKRMGRQVLAFMGAKNDNFLSLALSWFLSVISL